MLSRNLFLFLFSSLAVESISAQGNLKQGLEVPGFLKFQNATYDLAWSSHPSPSYYKYEYLQKQDSVRKYQSMILLEYVPEGLTAAAAIANKIEELKQLKLADNSIEFFSSFNAAGEQHLDFILTARGPGGKLSIAERNIYRYINSGKGIILLGLSIRKYGTQASAFLKNWKTDRSTTIAAFDKIIVPKLGGS